MKKIIMQIEILITAHLGLLTDYKHYSSSVPLTPSFMYFVLIISMIVSGFPYNKYHILAWFWFFFYP